MPSRRQWLQSALQKAAESTSALMAASTLPLGSGLASAMASGPAQALSPVRMLPPVIPPGEPIAFPRDFGAHPALRTEWWYITGSLWPAQGSASAAPRSPTLGFQITFFRSRVDTAQASPSRFAARQLVFAHTALSDLGRQELVHDQRIARTGFGLAEASERDTDITLRGWRLQRTGPVTQSQYRSHVVSRAFTLDLRFDQTQPVLLQGDAGFSRKARSWRRPATTTHSRSCACKGRCAIGSKTWPCKAKLGWTTNGASPCWTPKPWAGTGSA